MGRSDTKHLGTLPNAYGTLTRLAYAHAKANGIDTRTLLEKANLTLQQINNEQLKLTSSRSNYIFKSCRRCAPG